MASPFTVALCRLMWLLTQRHLKMMECDFSWWCDWGSSRTKNEDVHALLVFLLISSLVFHVHHSYLAAMATGWSISASWRAAVSTASGRSRSVPSTSWWISTELTALLWRRWSASKILPHPLSCCRTWRVTPILTLTKAPLRSPSPRAVSTLTPLTRREIHHRVCWNQLWRYDTPPRRVSVSHKRLVLLLNTHLSVWLPRFGSVFVQKPRLAHALCDYTPPHTAHLHFLRGDIIDLLDCSSSLSWRGRCRGRVGVFPPEYVQPLYHWRHIRTGAALLTLIGQPAVTHLSYPVTNRWND